MPNAFDSYIAKQCGYALHLDFLPEGVRPAPSAGKPIDELRARNRAKFRSDIGSILAGNYPDIVRIGHDNSAADQTTEAMNSGAQLIWNAHLPQDVVNQRAGRPNLLVRFGDAPQDGTWRYVPVTVQTHKTHNKQVSGRNSLILGSLNSLVINEGEVVNAAPRERKDVIKLSHYWLMLETLDRAPQGMAPTGGIIGRVDLQPELIWVSFDLDDYQDKFNQALAIIHHSETVTTSPLIDTSARSYRHTDCASCRWKMVCKEQWEARDDLGLAAVDREATRLKAEGLTTRTELAKLNLDATPPNKDDRMNAILKARAQIGNRAVIRPTANVAANLIPSADIEIDVDMENTEDHCYIWGTYTTIHGDSAPEGLTQGYRPFAVFESDGQTFAQANAENEAKAFANFWQWAQQLISECEQLGVSIGFYSTRKPKTRGSALAPGDMQASLAFLALTTSNPS